MKNLYKNYLKYFVLVLVLAVSACELDEVLDPNNPGLEDLLTSSTPGQIQNLIDGSESGMRNRMGTYLDGVGVIGRDFYRNSDSDPRFTSDLLGGGSATLDNNTFYTTGPFGARYRVVKNMNILMGAARVTTPAYSTAELSGIDGYAKTVQAYQLLLVLNQQFSNGVRIDVSDPLALGPFLDYAGSLAAIEAMLDDAVTDLTAAGADFAISLHAGYSGFDTPATFRQYNRALAARVNAYAGDKAGIISGLAGSFFNINGDMNTGVFHIFSTAGGDQTNPLWFPPNAPGEFRVVQADFLTDAEAGDLRAASKATERLSSITFDGLTGTHDVSVFANNTDNLSIIRNEELILLYAEAQIGGDINESLAAINLVRNAAGLGNYLGATDDASMINEMLNQRRYSLYGEGHRWVDMRRYNKLGELPIDRAEDDVWLEFPRPATEN